jgi:hypothetical protein
MNGQIKDLLCSSVRCAPLSVLLCALLCSSVYLCVPLWSSLVLSGPLRSMLLSTHSSILLCSPPSLPPSSSFLAAPALVQIALSLP